MNKVTFTITFLLLIFSKTFCQNYSLINKDRVYYYSDSGMGPNGDTAIHAIRIDSVSVTGTDSTFFNFKIFTQSFSSFPCDITLRPISSLGNKAVKHSNGDYIFFQSDTDSISVHSATGLSDTWTLYHFDNGNYIEATLSGIDYETFIGVSDSVKTITLQARDALNNPVTHPVNNQTIKFSKAHGFTRFLYLESFPNYIETVQIYGATNPTIGLQNLTAGGIFNYDVGDVFHYKSHGWTISPWYDEYMRKKILSKTVSVNLDTINYIDSVYWIRVTLTPPNIQTVSIMADTVMNEQFILSAYPQLGKLPMEPAYPLQAQENTGYALGFSSILNKRYRSYNPYDMYIYISDTCWQYPLIDGFPDMYYRYEGIAPGIYSIGFWDSQFSLNPYSYHHVVYYKKGPDEWGTPINFESILNSTGEITSENLEITFYPNPFHTSTTLHFNKPIRESYTLMLFDVFGKKVFEQMNIKSDVPIEGAHLSSGIYSYTLSSKEILLSGKLIAY